MTSFKTAIAIAIGTLFAGAALAQSNFEIEQRDRNEQARIDRGIQSGQITSREADRLQGQRAQIERMEGRARSDGVLSGRERARIDGAQDRLSRDIYRESHDRQTSNGYGRQSDNRGNGNGWGRGTERGYEHGARGGHTGYENGARGERSATQSNGWAPRTGTETRTSMSQAHATQSQGARSVTAARGDSGRRTR